MSFGSGLLSLSHHGILSEVGVHLADRLVESSLEAWWFGVSTAALGPLSTLSTLSESVAIYVDIAES